MNTLSSVLAAGITAIGISGCSVEVSRGTISRMECIEAKKIPKLTLQQLEGTIQGKVEKVCGKTIDQKTGIVDEMSIPVTTIIANTGVFMSNQNMQNFRQEPISFKTENN